MLARFTKNGKNTHWLEIIFKKNRNASNINRTTTIHNPGQGRIVILFFHERFFYNSSLLLSLSHFSCYVDSDIKLIICFSMFLSVLKNIFIRQRLFRNRSLKNRKISRLLVFLLFSYISINFLINNFWWVQWMLK